MPYVDPDYPTKKALKQAVVEGGDNMIHPDCGKIQAWWVTVELVQHSAVCHAVVTRRDENGAAVAWKWVHDIGE